MLIYRDGRFALAHALETENSILRDCIIAAAVRTTPKTPSEFLAAAQVLVYVVREGILDEHQVAIDYATAVLRTFEGNEPASSALRTLHALLPLCRPMEDPLPLISVGTIFEGLRTAVLAEAPG